MKFQYQDGEFLMVCSIGQVEIAGEHTGENLDTFEYKCTETIMELKRLVHGELWKNNRERSLYKKNKKNLPNKNDPLNKYSVYETV